jgi:Gti1/Pac2 family transcription factor
METYNGHVRTPNDAIILFEACRLGLLPRVQRRLSEKERQSIRSGSVFVWDEREAGMRRWTDGKSWSASRVSGSFLTYREMEGKRGGSGFAPPVTSRAGKTPDSGRNSGDDREMDAEEGPDGYRYKPDGLMKQSFSITTSNGQHLHLISYYARSHPNAPGLQQPSTDPNLRGIRPAKGMYPESSIADQSQMPPVTRAPMAGAPGYTMSPPNGGYPRPSATHPQGYIQQPYAPPGPPGYPYPPSPMTSPPNGYPYP